MCLERINSLYVSSLYSTKKIMRQTEEALSSLTVSVGAGPGSRSYWRPDPQLATGSGADLVLLCLLDTGGRSRRTIAFNGSVTSHAREVCAVAGKAAGFIQIQPARGVLVNESAVVGDGLEVDAFQVTRFATERVVDLGVADQAVRHLGEIGFTRLFGFLESPVASLAEVVRIQMTSDVTILSQIGTAVERCRDQRRQVAKFEVKLVVKAVGALVSPSF